uniref:Uncharacterized protein n=1 Tax=Clytia hemisphaerica TaxID=252671 RepID=A0A7M5UP32_9CNID
MMLKSGAFLLVFFVLLTQHITSSANINKCIKRCNDAQVKCTTGLFEDENERNSKCWNAFCKCKDECPKVFDQIPTPTPTPSTTLRRLPPMFKWYDIRNSSPFSFWGKSLKRNNPCRKKCSANQDQCLAFSQSFGDRMSCFRRRRFCFRKCKIPNYIKSCDIINLITGRPFCKYPGSRG